MKSKYVILLIVLGVISCQKSFGAWVVTYTMTPSVPGFTQIYGTAGDVVLPEPISCSDQITTASHVIGFTFQFDGTNYTTWQITDNGCLIFGGGAPTTCANPEFNSQIPNDLSDAATMYRPFLAPLWDELWFKPTSAFGQGSYLLSGSSPNRTLTIEWLYMSWRGAGVHTTDDISFQIVLHETSNVIDFIYRNDPGTLNIPTASCGLGAIAGGTYYSLSDLTGAPVVSSTVVTNSLALKPTNNGQMYRWTPTSGLPVELISFYGYSDGNGNILNWNVGSQTNNHYFTLLHSADGNDLAEVARVPGAGTTSEEMHYDVTDHFPFPGITYYKLLWTDYNGHSESSDFIAVASGTQESGNVFPNPTTGIVNAGTLPEQTPYIIVDAQGRIIQQGILEKGEAILDITGVENGMYFLILNDRKYKINVADHGR